jgi:hypothetical protein
MNWPIPFLQMRSRHLNRRSSWLGNVLLTLSLKSDWIQRTEREEAGKDFSVPR